MPNHDKSPIDKALARVAKARKRLDTEQGMVARRNARSEVLAGMREIRRILDRDFPIIAKKRKPRRKTTRVRDGFVPLTDEEFGSAVCREWLTCMAEAKTPIQVIRHTRSGVSAGTYVPEWAIAICEKYGGRRFNRVTSMLRKLKKDRGLREVELAAYKLRNEDSGGARQIDW